MKLIVGTMWEGKFSRVFHFPWDVLRESEPRVQKPTHSEWTDALRINKNTTHVPFCVSSKNAFTGQPGSDKWRRLTWAGWVEQPSCGALQPGSAPSPCSQRWSRPLPELRVTIPDNGWRIRLAGRRVACLAMLRLFSHRWSADAVQSGSVARMAAISFLSLPPPHFFFLLLLQQKGGASPPPHHHPPPLQHVCLGVLWGGGSSYRCGVSVWMRCVQGPVIQLWPLLWCSPSAEPAL